MSYGGQIEGNTITWSFVEGFGVYPPPAEVTYEITAHISEEAVFTGTIALPEVFSISGGTTTEELCPFYSADTNYDLRLTIGEAATLLLCWLSGDCEIGEAAAGLTLWLGGECYERTGTNKYENVSCTSNGKETTTKASKGTTATATRSLPGCFTQGQELTVSIALDFPAEAPQVVLLEDEPPAGWTVSNVSNNGTFSAGKVRWSFVDGLGNYPPPSQVTYTLTPASSGTVTFEGALASPDKSTVEGTNSLEECPLSIDEWNQY